MTFESGQEGILHLIQTALSMRRGHVDGRNWPLDRSIEERGVAQDFIEAALSEPGAPFARLRSRARGDDPPDCEARDVNGNRIAIELTELVDSIEIRGVLRGETVQPWTANVLIERLRQRIESKDAVKLKGGKYFEYIVVVYTADIRLRHDDVERWLSGVWFKQPKIIGRAYLSLDYDPELSGYPIIRLRWRGDAD